MKILTDIKDIKDFCNKNVIGYNGVFEAQTIPVVINGFGIESSSTIKKLPSVTFLAVEGKDVYGAMRCAISSDSNVYIVKIRNDYKFYSKKAAARKVEGMIIKAIKRYFVTNTIITYTSDPDTANLFIGNKFKVQAIGDKTIALAYNYKEDKLKYVFSIK